MERALTLRDVLKTYNPLYIIINGKHDYSKHREHFDDLPNEVLNTEMNGRKDFREISSNED